LNLVQVKAVYGYGEILIFVTASRPTNDVWL